MSISELVGLIKLARYVLKINFIKIFFVQTKILLLKMLITLCMHQSIINSSQKYLAFAKLNYANTKSIFFLKNCKSNIDDIHHMYRDCYTLDKYAFIRVPVLVKYRISSKFCMNRVNPISKKILPHNGVDFAIPVGTPVLSIGNGHVLVAKYSIIAGNYIVIRHNDFYTTKYMHLKKILVKSGQRVFFCQKIAISGNTGRSTGPHLHFELLINNKAVDPLVASLPEYV